MTAYHNYLSKQAKEIQEKLPQYSLLEIAVELIKADMMDGNQMAFELIAQTNGESEAYTADTFTNAAEYIISLPYKV